MKYPIFCIRDKATAFMQPMCDQSEVAAIRNFSKAVNNDIGMIGFQPSDFDLYQIGEFDDQSAVITPLQPIQFVVNGAALLKRGDAPDEV